VLLLRRARQTESFPRAPPKGFPCAKSTGTSSFFLYVLARHPLGGPQRKAHVTLPTRVTPTTLLLAAAAGLAGAPLAAQSTADPASASAAPLFAAEELLELTMVADFDQLEDDRQEVNPERPAILQLTNLDGAPIEVSLEVRTRGNFRLRRTTCAFPNLRLDFVPGSNVEHTVFAGQEHLKLVGHCRDSGEYEQNTLEEYLIYRLYNLISDESFRVRLARVTYRDIGGSRDPLTRYAFLMEDADRLAERFGGVQTEVQNAHPLELDARSSARVELFQYMIGNTDFSIINSHNVAIIAMPDRTYHSIPYDFDYSGLVEAPYAAPAAILGTSSVRERVYRGFCRPGLDPAAVFEPFLANRDAFSRILRQEPALEPKRAERAIRYLEEFFRSIESPRARQTLIERHCRTIPD
jgi:hypothetical protein